MNLKNSKERQPEPQQNIDSAADNSQVSPTCPKPNVSSSVLPPAPMRVRITKCSFEQGWYKNLVGEEFGVDNAGGNYDYVLWEDYAGKRTMWRHIAKSDCEVVSRHCC